MPYSFFTHLECPRDGSKYQRDQIATLCTSCGSPLFARYDLSIARPNLIDEHEPGLWRYHAVLPVFDRANRIYLGEGRTPLIHAQRLGAPFGFGKPSFQEET